MKSVLLTIGLFATFTISVAQEVWIQPEKFFYSSGDRLSASFVSGDDFIGEQWRAGNQIANLKLYQSSAVSDLSDSIRLDKKENLSQALNADGTHLLALHSNNILREFPADTFNLLIKAYELDAVKNQRTKTNSVTSPARVYQRMFTKLLFQVGEKRDDTYKKVLGWPVEIVPDRNPGSLKVGDQIRFKILFDGKPVFGVRAKLWNRFDNRTTLQNIYTEQDGTFEARISSPGPWMVSVMKMTSSKDSGADWQSYQGSLVFGFD
jgi:uncharacterized GH25 family protein